MKAARGDANVLARARAALSEALTLEGRFGEALAAVAVYESPEARRQLSPETDIDLRAQLGLALNYTGDYPKAIALLNAALRDAPEQGADAQRGAIYSALARVYRSINEYPIARDYSERALDHYRRAGHWRGLAESYIGLSLVDLLQGNYESGFAFSEQAVKLIGDLPLDVQPKLLRFLQEGEIQPLGEQRPQKVDVRIIAATNTDLEAMVADGRFREDLYYRLNVIRLRVPPLRERRSEIPAIVNYYVSHYSEKFKKSDVQMTPEAVDLLMVLDWPGNVRQLTNEIQRIVARAEDGATITAEHISPEFQPVVPRAAHASALALSQNVSLSDAVEDLERQMIAEALRKHNGNISRAARELGLTRRGLQLKLGRYQIPATA